jgi:hypothetical protein
MSAGLAALSALAVALGVVYLAVACQSLPGFLGSVAGDTHPRTRLGAALVVLALLLALASVITSRRRYGR